jgi:hypothetical protein
VAGVKLNAAGVISTLLELLVAATELATILDKLLDNLLSVLLLALVVVLPLLLLPPPPQAVSTSARVIKLRGRMVGLDIVMMVMTPFTIAKKLTINGHSGAARHSIVLQ